MVSFRRLFFDPLSLAALLSTRGGARWVARGAQEEIEMVRDPSLCSVLEDARGRGAGEGGGERLRELSQKGESELLAREEWRFSGL
jgi:hypothetical protein